MVNSAYGSSAVKESGQYLGVTTCGHDPTGEGATVGVFTKRAIGIIQAGSWEGPLKKVQARKEPLVGGAASSPSLRASLFNTYIVTLLLYPSQLIAAA
eukprot:6892145-Heterocapsa_arctica.AAC.1